VDAAHGGPPALDRASEISNPVDDAPDGIEIPAIQLQTSQLIRHLREQQRELDQRESQLNAMSAELENRQRRLRLWEQEQVASITRRQRELEFRARQLDGLEQREAALRQQQGLLEQQQEQWARERDQWESRWREQRERAAGEQGDRLERIQRREADLQQRQEQLQRQTDDLESSRGELLRIAQQLHENQQALERHRARIQNGLPPYQ
jgi:chromosome segregation ATPase